MENAKAVFLDKDGTVVQDVPYNVDPALVTYTRNAINALQKLQAYGFKLFLVTNQAGLAKGVFSENQFNQLKDFLTDSLASHGVHLCAFYYCPHHPDGNVSRYAMPCACRKPAPGMLLDAARRHNIDLNRSWMVGDILHDIEAGRRAGCRTVLIDNGNETEWEISDQRTPDMVACDLLEAAQAIMEFDTARSSCFESGLQTEEATRL